MAEIRIDETTTFAGVRLLINDQWHFDGPYRIVRAVGDLGHGHTLLVTNGATVYRARFG